MGPGPEAGLHPKARQTERYFALVLVFFGGLLDSSSQQMKVTGEGVARGERCPCQRKDSGLPSGELAQPASWMEMVFEYTGFQSLPSLPVFHTHPSQPPSHIPLSCSP